MTTGHERVTAACARAARAAEAEARGTPASWSAPSGGARRWFAIGDPQATPDRIFAVLDRHGLLADDGVLAPDAGLLSIGDHFDFPGDVTEVERAGREVLAWLAAHPRDQVVLLAGNHDLSRVIELAHETDGSFSSARALAVEIHGASGAEDRAAREREFAARYPAIPTPGIARVDCSSFSAAQRALVQRLLLERRLRLAAVARVAGVDVLVTHAGVTVRELGLLGMADAAGPGPVARALDDLLERRVDDARAAWTRGEPAPLDLGPVHVAGTTGREGGGLLYHRPARRDRPGSVDQAWELDPVAPRRFEPAALPRAFAQVAGHSGHRRCARELAGWVDANAPPDRAIALRTLRDDAAGPRYAAGVDPRPGALILIDPELARAPLEDVELLPLDGAPDAHATAIDAPATSRSR